MSNPHLPDGWDQPELTLAHFHEWVVDSGVDPAIVRLNVTSLTGDEVLEALIGDRMEQDGGQACQLYTRQTARLRDAREQLARGGWWCEGLCTLNGCRTPAGWGLFKPDHPITELNGRVRKYEHPLGVAERIVALRVPDPDFWARFKADPSIPGVLEEGAKKAGAWLTAGIHCIGLPGLTSGTPPADDNDPEPYIGNGYGDRQPRNRQRRWKPKKRKLHPDLLPLVPGRRWIISFDYEPTAEGQRRRDAATRDLIEQLYAAGAASVAVAHRQGPEKGADDLLVAKGPEALHALLETAEEQSMAPVAPLYSAPTGRPLTAAADPAEVLANHLADRIRRAIASDTPDSGIVATITQLANIPGTGKSHLAPQIGPRLLEVDGIDRVIYVAPGYRSPSIHSLMRWIEPPSRHSGLVVEQVEGQQRLRRRRRTDPEEDLVVGATCSYSSNLQRLREQGLEQEAITAFCQTTCPVRTGCRYLQERLSFLDGLKRGEHRLLRCSTEMLPALRHWLGGPAWQRTFLIFDEAPQIKAAALETTTIPLADMPAWATYLRTHQPELCDTAEGQQLNTLLDTIATLPDHLSEREAKYGCDPITLGRILPPVPATILPALQLPLITTDELTPDTKPLPQASPPPALLGVLLEALLPSPDGPVRSRATYSPQDGGQLQITTRSHRLSGAHLLSAGSLVLDGTAQLDTITRLLNGGPTPLRPELTPEAVTIPHQHRPAGLEVVQIPDLGAMGLKRGADQQRRLEALLVALQQLELKHSGPAGRLGVLEKSKLRSRADGHGAWFCDSRGSNAFEQATALALIGLPMPNLTAALAQFQVLYNQPLATITSAAFRDWYGRQVGEELIQGIHRLRPIRRGGELLRIYLITDADLSGVGMKAGMSGPNGSSFTVKASGYFTAAAAPKPERTRQRVIEAIEQLHQEGLVPAAITTRLVAERAGVGRNTAHRQAGEQPWAYFVEEVLIPW